MDNLALIKGQQVELDDKQTAAASKFHKSRIPFIFEGSKLHFNLNKADDRDHQHWVCEDLGWDISQFESANRGYIMPGKIQLYKGSDFRIVRISEVTIDHLTQMIAVHDSMFKAKDIKVYNGVKIGEPGEVWPPYDHLFTIKQG